MQNNELVTLFVMTEKGLAFVEQAVNNFKEIIAEVVIGQDSAVLNDYSTEISAICQLAGVKTSFRKNFKGTVSKYVIAVSWRWLINHPPEKLIVFHDSLLPRYRGFAPLVNALINGEELIGVSAIFGASEYDRGDIIHQSSVNISYPITIAEAIKQINACYLTSGLEVLKSIASGKPLKAKAQDNGAVSYSLWRDEEDYQINWERSASEIRRMIDAVGHPYKGAFCHINGIATRVFEALEQNDVRIENRTIGKVIFIEEGSPVIVCGTGLIKITNCVEDQSGTSLLPLTKFRTRFT